MGIRSVVAFAPLYGIAGIIVVGAAGTSRAANLLVNPGFEAPAEPAAVNSDCSGWSFVFDCQREPFANHTAGGTFGIWAKTFEPAGGGLTQNVAVTAGSTYNFSSYIWFEAAYPTTSATIQLGLTWLDASNSQVGTPNFLNIDPASITTTNAWTLQSVPAAVAPAGATQVQVFLGWDGGGTVTGQQSVFFDDADLEGAGTPPNTSIWVVNGSGDWNISGNWANGTIPSGVGAEADFFGAITANHTVYSDIAITAGLLNFNNSKTYVIGGAGSLTLQTATGSAQIIVQQGTQEINLPTTIASNTVFNVATGATLVIADPLTISAGKSITQTGGGTVNYQSIVTVQSGAAIAFGNSTHAHQLNLSSTATASIGGTGSVLTVDSLSNAGTVDVKSNELLVSYGSGATPAASIRSQLQGGLNGGRWNGTGLVSSAAAADPAHVTALGYLDTGSAVEVKYTWYGDANLDGKVTGSDVALISPAGTTWGTGDFNYDGHVSADDYALLNLALAVSQGQAVPVPEPAMAAGALVLALLPLARKRR